MPQSLILNYIHLVFSTKNREPLIIEKVENELYNYLGGICNQLECKPIKIGGWFDHVHILCMLSKKITLVNLLEELKSHSSKWIKTKDESLENFYWQRGYGAFSVTPSEVDSLILYIKNQKQHHQTQTFQTEYLSILKKYQVEYDERFVWA